MGLTSETISGSVMGRQLWSSEWEQAEGCCPICAISVGGLFIQRYRSGGEGRDTRGRRMARGGQGESLRTMVTSDGGEQLSRAQN